MFQPPWGRIRAQSASYCQMNNEAGREGLKIMLVYEGITEFRTMSHSWDLVVVEIWLLSKFGWCQNLVVVEIWSLLRSECCWQIVNVKVYLLLRFGHCLNFTNVEILIVMVFVCCWDLLIAGYRFLLLFDGLWDLVIADIWSWLVCCWC